MYVFLDILLHKRDKISKQLGNMNNILYLIKNTNRETIYKQRDDKLVACKERKLLVDFATKENKFLISLTQFNVHTNIINFHKHFSQDQDEDNQGIVGARYGYQFHF